MKCLKVIVGLLVLIVVFGVGVLVGVIIGFSNSKQEVTVRKQEVTVRVAGIPTSAIKAAENVFWFDKAKQAEFFKTAEKTLTADKSTIWKDAKSKEETIEKFKKTPPYVMVGDIVIFCDEKCQNFWIMKDGNTRLLPLVELKYDNKSGSSLTFNSPLEKDWISCRFSGTFYYSKEGDYKKAVFWITEQSGINSRIYYDNNGDSIFERLVHGNADILTEYRLNGMTYEKINEKFLNSQKEKLPNDSNTVPESTTITPHRQ